MIVGNPDDEPISYEYHPLLLISRCLEEGFLLSSLLERKSLKYTGTRVSDSAPQSLKLKVCGTTNLPF